MKGLLHSIEFAAFAALRLSVGNVPLEWAQRMGAAVGRILGKTAGFRWTIALDNLRSALPERSEAEVTDLAGRSFASVGVTLFELLRIDRSSPAAIRRMVTVEGEDILQEGLLSGKGVVLLTAHYGSWEIVPQALACHFGVRGTVLVRGLANQHVDRVIDRLRRTFGAATVPSTIAVRELFRTLHRGGLVIMAADQSAPAESPAVQFFGRWTPAFEGPAVLALRTGARIIFGVARRESDGTYRLVLERIPKDDLPVDDPDSVERLTERCLATTERAIRQDPSQWMWMHRRWKHIVPGRDPR
ncbi:MAG: lysophospholipid acyltransferase family protein [Bacteroidetes bacterium]|jgi:KDO2-lipid IV(A) lauroyltransferase|nr:lysophospholipid acyltransferase family protein [Bacteroidota bacterium]